MSKRNRELRSDRDNRQRKKINGSNGWASKLLNELQAGTEPEHTEKKKRKGRRDNAKRLRADFL